MAKESLIDKVIVVENRREIIVQHKTCTTGDKEELLR